MKFYLLSNNLGNSSELSDLFVIEENEEYIMIAETGRIINIFSKEKMESLRYMTNYFRKEVELYEVYLTLNMDEIKKNIKNAMILKENKKLLIEDNEQKEKILNMLGV